MNIQITPIFKKSTLLFSLAGIGCTSVTVTPLDSYHQVKTLCIRENPKVTVPDFVPVIQDGLNRHEIQSEWIPFDARYSTQPIEPEESVDDRYYMYITALPDTCEYSLAYTARRSWDLGTYLSTADIEISDSTSIVASANYHLIGKGGFSLYKWQGVKTKIDPVMDQLFEQYPLDNELKTLRPMIQNETPISEVKSTTVDTENQETLEPLFHAPTPPPPAEGPKDQPLDLMKTDSHKDALVTEPITQLIPTPVAIKPEGPRMTECIENWKKTAWYAINSQNSSADTDELEHKIRRSCEQERLDN